MSQTRESLGQGHSQEMEELAAGLALDALDEADAARFRIHLVQCPRCQTLIADFQAVAAHLPETLEEMEASPGLRARILDAARAEPRERPAPDRTPERGPQQIPPGSLEAERRRRAPYWALSLAAIFLVTLGMGSWNYSLQQRLDQQSATLQLQQRALAALAAGGPRWALAGTESMPRAGGLVIQDPADPRPLLLVHGLPDLPSQQAYQAWVIAGGAPTAAGVLRPGAGGEQIARLDRPLGNAETVALTIEPAQGSRLPTGPIVLAGQI